MLQIFLFLLIMVHGLIHLIGFSKAFHFGKITQFTNEISKPTGLLWAIAAAMLLLSGIFLLMRKESWWMILLPAVLLSQGLILSVWADAKFGTVANLVLLVIAILAAGNWRFEQSYRNDVELYKKTLTRSEQMLTEKDLEHLPPPVQRYLRYVGVLNKSKVTNYRARFRGEMRDRERDWFPFTSVQHNFTAEPVRLFFMKARMYGITVPGYHAYRNGRATMQIKLFGMLPIVNEKEGILDKAETVTVLNDMCLLAPATLIESAIRWQEMGARAAKASLTVGSHTVSAILHFNDQGELVNFISDDRFAIADKKQYRFSTPVKAYKNFSGFNLPSYGEAIWHYPDQEFAYGKFYFEDVEYNVR